MNEKKITNSIILVPIFSLFLFSLILMSALYLYFQSFQKEEINEYKSFILQQKKQTTKSILLSEIQSLNHDLVDLNNNIKTELKERINEANKIINRVIENNPNKSQQEIKEIIKQVLSAIRFNDGRGYYFAYNKSNHINLIHPIKKFINKDMSDFQDVKGDYLIKIVDTLINKQKEGYTEIYFAKPTNPNKEFKKIIYVKYIPQLNWVIGTGEYIDEAMNELKKEKLKEITEKKYGKNGYFWVHDTNYNLLAHPFRKNDIGKNDENLTDIKGNKIIQLFVNEAKKHQNGSFVKYYWQNPDTKKIEEKTSFVYYLPKFDWVIGTGLYLKDLQPLINNRINKTKKETKELIISIALILILSVLIVSYISYKLSIHTTRLFNLYKHDLENRIKKAVDENTKKDQILQQQSKLASMGEMIGAIAHQWRQPLNSLALNIQILVDDYLDKKINEKYLENFEEKQMETINFMSKTIDDFRNFFKIDKEKETFSVKEAINEIINLLSCQLNNHNIKINLKGGDFSINGYKSEFKQVILNLINNAKDSILSNPSIKNGEITITIQNNEIIIQDNGEEIPTDIQKRLFEPYFTTKENGTGIGLYMSKNIISQMGGKLIFEAPKKFIIKGLK